MAPTRRRTPLQRPLESTEETELILQIRDMDSKREEGVERLAHIRRRRTVINHETHSTSGTPLKRTSKDSGPKRTRNDEAITTADHDELAHDNEDHTVVQARHHLQTQHAHTTVIRRSKRLGVAPHTVQTPLMRNVGDNSPIKVRKRQRMSQMQNCEHIRQPQQADLPGSDLNGADGASQTKHNKSRLDNTPPTYPTVVYEHGKCADIWCAICGTNATGSSDPIAFFKGFMRLKRHILRSHKPKGPFQPSDDAIWRCIAFREISAENQAKIQIGAELDIEIEKRPRRQVNTRLIERHLVDPESIGEETIVGDTAVDTALAAGTETAVPVKTKVPRMPTIVEEGTSVSNIAAVFGDQKSATGNDADTRDRVTKDAEAPIDGESAVDTIVVADPRRKRPRFSLLGRSSRS